MRKFREVEKKLGKRGKGLPYKGVPVRKLTRGDEVFFGNQRNAIVWTLKIVKTLVVDQ